jgi:hypothetical protein
MSVIGNFLNGTYYSLNGHHEHINLQPVRSAYQPPASSTFLSERISHQQPAATSQQYSSLRTNQHQPSATSQPNSLVKPSRNQIVKLLQPQILNASAFSTRTQAIARRGSRRTRRAHVLRPPADALDGNGLPSFLDFLPSHP